MAEYDFERDCRTPNSEAYIILDGESPIGHVDLHYAATVVHATLCVVESLTQENIREIIDVIDEELVDIVGVMREEFIVHVFQGRELGVFTDSDFGSNGGNGAPKE
jgi:hypothetical protein